MQIVEIAALSNGAHNNQTIDGVTPETFPIPEGWAMVPEDLETPNFPFGEVTAEEMDGIMTVTSWSPLPIPEPEPERNEPTQLDIIEAQVTYTAMMTDTLLEV